MIDRVPAGRFELLAQISQLLEQAGFRRYVSSSETIFEDSHSVVSVCTWDSVDGLIRGWPEAQGQLVDLLTEKIDRLEPKAWDGYLVLGAPGGTTERESRDLTDVEYDVSRVRKIVVRDSGGGLEEVRTALRPILPLQDLPAINSDAESDWVPSLRESFTAQGLDPLATDAMIEAYLRNGSLMDAIASSLDDKP